MNRYSLDLTLELLSPCFLGGAFQQPEFRIASLRGVWRYWYRALYGRGNETAPGEEEQKLFGGVAARGGGVGYAAGARVVLRGLADDLRASAWRSPRPATGDGRAGPACLRIGTVVIIPTSIINPGFRRFRSDTAEGWSRRRALAARRFVTSV